MHPKHSPVPWRVATFDEGDRFTSILRTDQHTAIAWLYGARHGQENADRIVACVNACAELVVPARVAELIDHCRELLADQDDEDDATSQYAEWVLNFLLLGTETPRDADDEEPETG